MVRVTLHARYMTYYTLSHTFKSMITNLYPPLFKYLHCSGVRWVLNMNVLNCFSAKKAWPLSVLKAKQSSPYFKLRMWCDAPEHISNS